MSIEKKIKSFSENHSIKEAAVSLFLANPILKPDRFKKLIETELKEQFQQFELVSQIQFQIKKEKGILTNFDTQDDIGFKLTSFDKGHPVAVLQGINEVQRNYISYHGLKYERWENYFENFKSCLDAVLTVQNDLFINAFSLLYVDEFFWIGEEEMNLDVIFNKDSKYIPCELFESTKTNFSLTTEKDNKSTLPYVASNRFDRLDVVVESSIKPSIRISHNVTQPLKDITDVKTLTDEEFKAILDEAHHYNKSLLKEILTKDVLSLIKLS